MRVLVWSEYFWPYVGGVEVGSRQLLPALRERGCEIAVITGHDNLDLPDEDEYDGMRIHRFPFRASLREGNLDRLVQARRSVAALKRSFRPDLVHVNSFGPSMLFHLRTSEAHPVPTLVTLRLKPGQGALGPGTLFRTMLRSADWLAACSAGVLDEAVRQAPELGPRSSVIHNGMPMPALTPSALPFDPPRLLCLGRLVPQKGLDIALRALVLLGERAPAVRLVIAGDGPLRPELEALAAELGVAERVEFLGWVAPDQVPATINAATLLVMPSWNEGLPIAGIQAAQMGRPTVATRVSGLPELVVDGETGLLVEPGDAHALAAAVVRLLERPRLARQIGEAARRRARAAFGLDRCADAYRALYATLSGDNPHAAS